MNVKELRQKLEKIPDDAAVRFVSGAEDNLTNDYYDTETAIYVERLERDGDYCIPCIERMDSRRPSPIHADEKERVLRCECFTPIPEDEEEKK